MRLNLARQRLLILALAVVSALFLGPVVWMCLMAVRPQAEVFSRTLHILPSQFAWQNLSRAWNMYPIADWFFNSVVLTIIGASLTVFLDLLAGYAFAKFNFVGRDALFIVFLCTLMLPTQVFLVPQFLLTAHLGGMNTYWAVILPKAAETYGIFLARQFLVQVPDDLLEAARLDGASEWTIFWRVVVPLSRPAIAVLAILSVLGVWNDFSWPMVILKDQHALTLPVGLSHLQGEHVTDWTGIMIIAMISIAPVLLMFLALQRYFVQGIARAGLK